jgi:hypothetical protein
VDAGAFDLPEDTELARLLRFFYGIDWADRESRTLAVQALQLAAAPGFEWQVAARLPPLHLVGEAIGMLGESIDRDFSVYRLRPTERHEPEADVLVVGGWVFARTRHTRETLRRRFEDTWRFEADRPVRLISR